MHARTHFPFHPRNRALSSPSCPIKRRNLRKWNETSKSRLLLWLTWYDLYYNLDPVLLFFLPLPPTNAFPNPFSLLSLLRLALVKSSLARQVCKQPEGEWKWTTHNWSLSNFHLSLSTRTKGMSKLWRCNEELKRKTEMVQANQIPLRLEQAKLIN